MDIGRKRRCAVLFPLAPIPRKDFPHPRKRGGSLPPVTAHKPPLARRPGSPSLTHSVQKTDESFLVEVPVSGQRFAFIPSLHHYEANGIAQRVSLVRACQQQLMSSQMQLSSGPHDFHFPALDERGDKIENFRSRQPARMGERHQFCKHIGMSDWRASSRELLYRLSVPDFRGVQQSVNARGIEEHRAASVSGLAAKIPIDASVVRASRVASRESPNEIAHRSLCHGTATSICSTAEQPCHQFVHLRRGKFLDGLFDFSERAHGRRMPASRVIFKYLPMYSEKRRMTSRPFAPASRKVLRHSFRPVLYLKLYADVLHIRPHGLGADPKAVGDLLIDVASGE